MTSKIDGLNVVEIHGRMRDWYLARLRSEATELAQKAAPTPYARITADQFLLEQLVQSAATSIPPKRKLAVRKLPPISWCAGLIVCLLMLCIQLGPVVALKRFFSCTIGVLLFIPTEQFTHWEAASSFVFFLIPLVLSAATSCLSHSGETPGKYRSRKFNIWKLLLSLLIVGATTRLLWSAISGGLLPDSQQLFSLLGWTCLILTSVNLIDEFHAKAGAETQGRCATVLAPILGKELEQSDNLLESATRSMIAFNQHQDLIADFAPDLTLVLDRELTIWACNRTVVRLLGHGPEELISKRWEEFFLSPANQNPIDSVQLATDCAHAIVEKESYCVSKSGEIVNFRTIFEWSQSQQLYFVLARDVTNEKREEQTRSDYLAMISHDVKGPLVSIVLGVSSVLNGTYGSVSTPIESALERSTRNLDSIVEILDEIIDLERSARTSVSLDKESCGIAEVVSCAIEQTRDLAAHLGVKVTSVGLDYEVVLDRKRILRVIVNLLLNAIKHSPVGEEVRIVMSVDSKTCRVEIIDSGPGIPRAHAAAVFNRYYQVQEGREVKGTGLGLAICRLFVELHGGRIGVNAGAERGSIFWFCLPLDRQ